MDGTSDYSGGNTTSQYCGSSLCPYWYGHLSFAYDYVDPSQIRINIGYNLGIRDLSPYGVKNNIPAHANISVSTGPVKYELVSLTDLTAQYGYPSTGGKPLITQNNNSNVVGVLMVQMISDRTLIMEFFGRKTESQVSSFTSAAKIYRR
jgi:hypothetical protein